MVLCLLCQNKIEVIRIRATLGWNDFDKCFFSHKKLGSGSPAQSGFSTFFSVSWQPQTRMQSAFSQIKNAHNSFLKFVQCFSQQFQRGESGSRHNFSTSVFLQLKNRAGVLLHSTGFSNLFNVFDNSNSLEKETLVKTKKKKLEQPFLAHFFS
jgi:hypothetical protein